MKRSVKRIVKRSGGDEIGTTFLSGYIYDAF